jgi:hypothetical protein
MAVLVVDLLEVVNVEIDGGKRILPRLQAGGHDLLEIKQNQNVDRGADIILNKRVVCPGIVEVRETDQNGRP